MVDTDGLEGDGLAPVDQQHQNTREEMEGGVRLSQALESFSLTYSPTTKRLTTKKSPTHQLETNKFSASDKQKLYEEDRIYPTEAADSSHVKNCAEVILDVQNSESSPQLSSPSRSSELAKPDMESPSIEEINGDLDESIDLPGVNTLEEDTITNGADEPTRFIHCHRKAFSLPRTLEVINDDGSISHYPQPQVESPRTTLQRFGMVQVPVHPTQDDLSSISSISNRTGFSEIDQYNDSMSQGDSGVHSQTASTASTKPVKKGITELISKGISSNWKLLSKSSHQMVRMMRRPDTREPSSLEETVAVTASSPSSVVSSQSLIMEDRPAGLPAKLTQEKEKHSQEFQAILESMKRKNKEEKSEMARRQAEQRRMEDDLSASVGVWTTQILPNWSTVRTSKKTQQLWWKGLPPSVRGKVWKCSVENQLNLTPQLYAILVQRAESQINLWRGGKGRTNGVTNSPCREETLELICLDVSRTFPQLCIFQKGGPYYDHLHNVLGAYVCYRPDLGYVQGMSFIAAILILNLDEEDAFILFANLVNRPPNSAFFNMDQTMMESYYSNFSSLMRAHLPEVSAHLEGLGLRPDMYLIDWIMTLYGRAAPLDLACRIWDLMFRDGQDFIFKAALGILSLFKERIIAEQDFTEIAQFLSKLPENINADALFFHIQELNFQPRQKSFQSLFSTKESPSFVF